MGLFGGKDKGKGRDREDTRRYGRIHIEKLHTGGAVGAIAWTGEDRASDRGQPRGRKPRRG